MWGFVSVELWWSKMEQGLGAAVVRKPPRQSGSAASEQQHTRNMEVVCQLYNMTPAVPPSGRRWTPPGCPSAAASSAALVVTAVVT